MSEEGSLATVWFEHRWRVQKEELRKKEFDEAIKSPKFLTIKNGLRYHWQLELHPKGEKTEDYPTADKQPDMILTMWICQGGIQSAVEAKFLKVAVVGGNENSSDESEMFNCLWDTEPSKGKYRGQGFDIYPHQELNEVGTATEVEFRVQIGIQEQDFDLHHIFPDPPLHNCPKGLALYKETVLQEQSYVGRRDEGNATLIAGRERIQCHRLMLMGSSPVFQRMFASERQESETGEVAISDVSAATLKQLLYFCYICGGAPGWLERWSPALGRGTQIRHQDSGVVVREGSGVPAESPDGCEVPEDGDAVGSSSVGDEGDSLHPRLLGRAVTEGEEGAEEGRRLLVCHGCGQYGESS